MKDRADDRSDEVSAASVQWEASTLRQGSPNSSSPASCGWPMTTSSLSPVRAIADLYVKNLATAELVRASIATDGTQGNGESGFGVISPDGGFVVFMSDATNLVAGDTNAKTDAFRHDLTTRTTVRVSLANSGAQSNGIVFATSVGLDGRLIAFVSSATNLVGNDTNASVDVFVRDVGQN